MELEVVVAVAVVVAVEVAVAVDDAVLVSVAVAVAVDVDVAELVAVKVPFTGAVTRLPWAGSQAANATALARRQARGARGFRVWIITY